MKQFSGSVRVFTAFLALGLLAGCGSILRKPPPPAEAAEELAVLGIPNARFWIDGQPDALIAEGRSMVVRDVATRPAGTPRPPTTFLAISGGADNGAFGAGLLTGWTAQGNRPVFNVVTGISAGALIAPFAFLGSDYDPQLREVFTQVAPRDVLLLPRQVFAVFPLLFGEALADTSPLARLINRHANQEMLDAIAREYMRGRLLLVGTTNLDLQRPVVWNIGAIAASGHPEALQLFRSILLASASIPGAFPPVLVPVDYDGRSFEEMHVDGGAAMQVFLYPPSLPLRERVGERERTAYVIRNGRINVEASATSRGVFSIARRSAATLLHFSGISDINRIYLTTQRDGVAFRLAFIGSEFQADRREPFDPPFMQALFDYGYALASQPWHTVPPGVSSTQAPAAR
ncbi:patatin-like phospholipase family protein [Roseococcus pinisoli]|uniref:Patatin-like phospholipase family protein n=1 Tax=Roseococcus pinisoli TaxID=2835040 RepID=A0ABS5QER0_9PROT|nr:patatin-like phospholipase family protein [Roseococcus pinisoli]MBS7811415.1 patatin-like phospholipase family protein [Roseococcus pinisoli]